jgi:hypothetical protein
LIQNKQLFLQQRASGETSTVTVKGVNQTENFGTYNCASVVDGADNLSSDELIYTINAMACRRTSIANISYNPSTKIEEVTSNDEIPFYNTEIIESRTPRTTVEQTIVEEKMDPDHKLAKLTTPGVKGCFYSHYRLWKKCVTLNEPIIIWEDDIRIYRPYSPVEWEDILVVSLGHPGKSQKYIDYLENPSGVPEAKDYYQASMPGCCGYAIKPHAAKKLLKTYKNTYLPADNAINQLHVKIQIHSHIMGTALLKKDGKKSLTRTNFWNDYCG